MGIELPAWLDPDAWAGFVESRKAMGRSRPFTERAAQLSIRKLEEIRKQGYCPNAALDQSVQRGWQGIFPDESKRLNEEAKKTSQMLDERTRQVPSAELAAMCRQAVKRVK